MQELHEAQCRNALYQLPCGQRMAAAERHPHWAQMTWQEKLRAVKAAEGQPELEWARSMPELSARGRSAPSTPQHEVRRLSGLTELCSA